jgi:hypothetical protein
MMSKRIVLSTAALLGAVGYAEAQITVESVFSYVDNNADNAEGLGVFDASAFDKLVVIVSGEHGFPDNTSGINITGVTYDGVAMLPGVTRDGLPEVNNVSPDQGYNHIYYLDNPFGNTGTLTVNSNLSRYVVTAIGLDGTAEGIGATAVSGLSTKSIEFTTTTANSFVLASNGLGGTGNNGNVDGLTTNSPLSFLASAETQSNYAGHLIGGATVATPSTDTYSFTGNTSGSHVIAAEFLLGPPPAILTLQVNTTNGKLTMIGDDGEAISFGYYEISSGGNTLNATGWNSLADQDYDGNGPANGSGNGWEEAGGADSATLAEAFLLGNSEIAAGQEVGLGIGYDTAVDARDLAFRFLTERGKIRDGAVEYFSPLMADADNDGDVDSDDFNILAFNFGEAGGWADGDFDGDGTVESDDFNLLAFNFGTAAAAISLDEVAAVEAFAESLAVPEPNALALFTLGGLLLAQRRRRSS